MSAELVIIGTPLDEESPLAPYAIAALESAQLLIGESRKIAMRLLASSKIAGWREKPLFLLDQQRPDEAAEMESALRDLATHGGRAALFSDCGMPVLFDPGESVVRLCRQLGYRIRSRGGETSWGTAAALSGFGTPFLVAGFPPRENEERRAWLAALKNESAHTVLMDTPYRFTALLGGLREQWGGGRFAFLAWEIGKEGERLQWGTLDELAALAAREQMKKGEFVLVLQGIKAQPENRPRAKESKPRAHSR